jgi:hypothetical protein
MQTWRIREPVMWLAEEISGNRKTYGMNTIGGVRRDVAAPLIPKLLATVAEVERELTAVRDALVGDTTLHARTRGVGRLETGWAREVCVVGPPARASNIAIDARLDHPYAAYDEIVPRICTDEGGDTWARVVVRLNEAFESIRLVRETLAHMPDGPVLTEIHEPIPAGRIGVSTVEAPRGEAVHAVLTGDDNRPYRWRVRALPTLNLQAVPAMIQHQMIADVPITIGSLDPCFSCTERMEAVDVASGAVRAYSCRELAALARGGGRAMSWNVGAVVGPALLNAVLVLVLALLAEGVMRKLRALIHSRMGPDHAALPRPRQAAREGGPPRHPRAVLRRDAVHHPRSGSAAGHPGADGGTAGARVRR